MDKNEKFTSRRTSAYKKMLEKLPAEIQDACQETFLNWKKDPSSLKMKPLGQFGNQAYSAEINLRYRALGFKSKDEQGRTQYNWFWVGSHEDYNKVITNTAITSKIKKMREREENPTLKPNM